LWSPNDFSAICPIPLISQKAMVEGILKTGYMPKQIFSIPQIVFSFLDILGGGCRHGVHNISVVESSTALPRIDTSCHGRQLECVPETD
jgi:hypothetical protein